MDKRSLALIKDRLLAERSRLIKNAREALEVINNPNPDNLNDEVDVAAVEQDESVNLRLRDREAGLLNKIEQTLRRLDEVGRDFGFCESCGGEIGLKRLLARPVATLCIHCKEEQEQREQGYAN